MAEIDMHQVKFSKFYEDLRNVKFHGELKRNQKFPPFVEVRAIVEVKSPSLQQFDKVLKEVYRKIQNHCRSYGKTSEWIWKGWTIPEMDPEYNASTLFACHPLDSMIIGHSKDFRITDVKIERMVKHPKYPYEYIASLKISPC